MSNGRTGSLLALAGFGLATAAAAWYGARYALGNCDGWYRWSPQTQFDPA